MPYKDNLIIFFLALALSVGIASSQTTSGYMDADYYYATGIQLAEGRGFTEPFLWNYLDDPTGLPHPSHAYWMPLASILSALGMSLARNIDFASAQGAFILLAALIPPITASLAYFLTSRRDLALTSALFALFSGYYAPPLTTTDTFSIYILLGGLFFLTLKIRRIWLKSIVLGIIAALMYLARADGAIWLIFAVLALIMQYYALRKALLSSLVFFFLSYFFFIVPWLLRNYLTFGSPFALGGGQMLWLTDYNQIFAYPAGNLSMDTWLASGWYEVIKVRLWAFKLNFGTVLGVQGGIFLLPFIILGAWKLRKNLVVRIGVFAWIVTFFVMTIIFPFAGARGGFLHSGSALQPLWWALAPIGLTRVIAWLVKRYKWKPESLKAISVILVAISLLMTGAIMWMRVLSPMARTRAQNKGVPLYISIEESLLAQKNPTKSAAVITANPPGYYLASHRYAIALPDGDIEGIFALAERYNAEFLILEEGAVTEGLMPIFDAPTEWGNLALLAEIKGAKIFVVEK